MDVLAFFNMHTSQFDQHHLLEIVFGGDENVSNWACILKAHAYNSIIQEAATRGSGGF